MSDNVLIGVPATELMYTQVAYGWLKLLPTLPAGIGFTLDDSSCSVPGKRNQLVHKLLQNMQYEWLWMIDSDILFSPGRLGFDQLLESGADADIVGSLFRGTRAFSKGFIDAGWKKSLLSADPLRPTDVQNLAVDSLPLSTPATGPVEVDYVGTECTLYHRRLFVKLDPPWFVGNERFADGQNEDWNFALRASANGFRIVVDTRVRPEHLGVQGVMAKVGSTD